MIRLTSMTLLAALTAAGATNQFPPPRGDYEDPGAHQAMEELAGMFRSEAGEQSIRVLAVTATHGYRHSSAIEATRALFAALEKTTEFRVDFTENVGDFNAARLKAYDLLFFANSTLRVDEPTGAAEAAVPAKPEISNPVTAEHRAAIIGFLSNGGGVVAAHSALDAFYGWGEYRRMVGGGLFEAHPWTQQVRILIEEPGNPATAHLGGELRIRDEIYVLDHNPRRNSHVLMSLDTTSVDIERGPAGAGRNDFPISWLRDHKGGRVFVTKLGHFADVWTNPAFVQHLLQGMRMTAGRIPADFASQRITRTVAEIVWPDAIAADDEGRGHPAHAFLRLQPAR